MRRVPEQSGLWKISIEVASQAVRKILLGI
jgi:hypothetical protein